MALALVALVIGVARISRGRGLAGTGFPGWFWGWFGGSTDGIDDVSDVVLYLLNVFDNSDGVIGGGRGRGGRGDLDYLGDLFGNLLSDVLSFVDSLVLGDDLGREVSH